MRGAVSSAGAMMIMMMMMMWKQEGSRGLVSKPCAEGESHNCAAVKCSVDWFVKTSV